MAEKSTYIIGEIGQNHNGSVEVAKLIIELMAMPIEEKLFGLELKGVDAVKLTKRDLNQELSDSQMHAPYTGRNSFGPTYGEHRAALELSDEEHFEAYKCAKSYGMDFVETLCAPACLSMLKLFSPDKLKVASRDLTNLPLLHALAETKIPIIVSTGMAGKKELDKALEVITSYHNDVSILHCVSQYPTEPRNVNFNTIPYLKKNYPNHTIGYSDHTIGISAPVAAVALGAEIIEKHITLDRRMRGTDQAGSLGPDGVKRMVRDIRLTDMSMGVEDIFISESTDKARVKLERSIAAKRDIAKGEEIKESDLFMLSPGDGYKWSERNQVIGKTADKDLKANEVIYPQSLNG
ncbi:MAG: N-acetylneuraminate synthase family protein [Flavobacteriales bacterium]|nr:N-acetylneuraminate synthase family protein [Flavobacteriales bacterium]